MRTGEILNMALLTARCRARMGFNGLSCFENSGGACMELLQMFGKLWRIKVWQRLNIVEKSIEILTKFRRGPRGTKPDGQPIQR